MEKALLETLVAQVEQGYRADNSFKPQAQRVQQHAVLPAVAAPAAYISSK
jgi:hypothetical protein